MKTFLSPEALRRGQPVMHFISSERSVSAGPRLYWLGTYHHFVGRGAPAVAADYKGVSRVRISRDCYMALLREAQRQHRLYSTPLAQRRIS